MYVFLSYAREDRELAERIRGALVAAGFDCFLDTKSLPPGQEYNTRTREAVNRANLFIFLLSPPALTAGSYTLTELQFAEEKWPNPAGYLLPVGRADIELGPLPAYIRPINAFRPPGNIPAAVLAWVEQRAKEGGGGGEETPLDRLSRWTRLNQPPLRRIRMFPFRAVALLLGGLAFIGFGLLVSQMSPGFTEMTRAMTVIPIVVGCAMTLFAVVMSIQGLVGASPVAALVLDRTVHRGITVHLLLADDTRKSYSAVGRAASNAYPGEVGWAFIAGGMLLGFERGPQTPSRTEV